MLCNHDKVKFSNQLQRKAHRFAANNRFNSRFHVRRIDTNRAVALTHVTVAHLFESGVTVAPDSLLDEQLLEDGLTRHLLQRLLQLLHLIVSCCTAVDVISSCSGCDVAHSWVQCARA